MHHQQKYYPALVCWLALIPLTIVWDGVFSPLHTGRWLLMLKLLPLCLPLRGLLSGRIYTYQYCSMLILLPFAEGVMRIWDAVADSAWFAFAQTLLSMGFFVYCLIYLKQFKRTKSNR